MNWPSTTRVSTLNQSRYRALGLLGRNRAANEKPNSTELVQPRRSFMGIALDASATNLFTNSEFYMANMHALVKRMGVYDDYMKFQEELYVMIFGLTLSWLTVCFDNSPFLFDIGSVTKPEINIREHMKVYDLTMDVRNRPIVEVSTSGTYFKRACNMVEEVDMETVAALGPEVYSDDFAPKISKERCALHSTKVYHRYYTWRKTQLRRSELPSEIATLSPEAEQQFRAARESTTQDVVHFHTKLLKEFALSIDPEISSTTAFENMERAEQEVEAAKRTAETANQANELDEADKQTKMADRHLRSALEEINTILEKNMTFRVNQLHNGKRWYGLEMSDGSIYETLPEVVETPIMIVNYSTQSVHIETVSGSKYSKDILDSLVTSIGHALFGSVIHRINVRNKWGVSIQDMNEAHNKMTLQFRSKKPIVKRKELKGCSPLVWRKHVRLPQRRAMFGKVHRPDLPEPGVSTSEVGNIEQREKFDRLFENDNTTHTFTDVAWDIFGILNVDVTSFVRSVRDSNTYYQIDCTSEKVEQWDAILAIKPVFAAHAHVGSSNERRIVLNEDGVFVRFESEQIVGGKRVTRAADMMEDLHTNDFIVFTDKFGIVDPNYAIPNMRFTADVYEVKVTCPSPTSYQMYVRNIHVCITETSYIHHMIETCRIISKKLVEMVSIVIHMCLISNVNAAVHTNTLRTDQTNLVWSACTPMLSSHQFFRHTIAETINNTVDQLVDDTHTAFIELTRKTWEGLRHSSAKAGTNISDSVTSFWNEGGTGRRLLIVSLGAGAGVGAVALTVSGIPAITAAVTAISAKVAAFAGTTFLLTLSVKEVSKMFLELFTNAKAYNRIWKYLGGHVMSLLEQERVVLMLLDIQKRYNNMVNVELSHLTDIAPNDIECVKQLLACPQQVECVAGLTPLEGCPRRRAAPRHKNVTLFEQD